MQRLIDALMSFEILPSPTKMATITPVVVMIAVNDGPFFPPALCCGIVSGEIVSVEFEVVGALVALTFGACASAAVGRCKLKRCLAYT